MSSIAKEAGEDSGSSGNRASAMSLPELAANGVLPESSQDSAPTSRLRILRLDGNATGPGAGRALLPLLRHVQELFLSGMAMGDEGTALLYIVRREVPCYDCTTLLPSRRLLSTLSVSVKV